MTVQPSTLPTGEYGSGAAQRVLSWLLAGVIVLGSAFLWIGVPTIGLWLAGQLTRSSQGFLFAALGGIPTTMVGAGWLLYRVNAVYERLHGEADTSRGSRSAWNVSLSDERSGMRRARAPRTLIDVAMTASAVTAMVLAVIWFFFFAHTILAPMS